MKQGRHRYYQLAGPHVAQMLESVMNVALTGPPRFQPKSRLDETMRNARTCYDHIAGVLGVGLAKRLTEREFVVLGEDAGEVTPAGAEFLSKFGVDYSLPARSGESFAVRASTGLKGARISEVPSGAAFGGTGALS